LGVVPGWCGDFCLANALFPLSRSFSILESTWGLRTAGTGVVFFAGRFGIRKTGSFFLGVLRRLGVLPFFAKKEATSPFFAGVSVVGVLGGVLGGVGVLGLSDLRV
jgi:hypothetical protein